MLIKVISSTKDCFMNKS